ncbi:hypothetical protein ACJX0J_021990, partial [Zea mays]
LAASEGLIRGLEGGLEGPEVDLHLQLRREVCHYAVSKEGNINCILEQQISASAADPPTIKLHLLPLFKLPKVLNLILDGLLYKNAGPKLNLLSTKSDDGVLL